MAQTTMTETDTFILPFSVYGRNSHTVADLNQ